MAEPEPKLEGRVIAGNFRIERVLGRGAMGQVYLAEQMSLGKKVAIKVIHRHLQHDEALAKRFHREAKAASSLNHPNSLQIIDFGQSDQGELFIAMELLSGRDLNQIIHTDAPLPLERIVRIMSQVLSALDEAHAQNIIHRDLKPENIMIMDRRGERDFVKVCDFGIAKIQDPKSDGSSGTITMAGVVCGTPEYMSPEQCRGEKLDGRSDLYACGVILYQMATRTLPFTAESALGIVTKHLTETPVPPSQKATTDPRLEALILEAMQKDREKRPKTAFDMKEQLESLLRGRSSAGIPARGPTTVARAATISEGIPSAPSPTLAGELVGSGEMPIARRGRAALVGAALVLVAGAGIGFLVLRKSGTAPAAQVQPAPAVAQPAVQPPPPEPQPVPAAAVVEEKPREPDPPPAEPPKAHKQHPSHHEKKVAAAAAPAKDVPPPPVETPKETPKPSGSPAQQAYKAGMDLFEQGRLREAIAKYQDAVRLDAGYAEAYRALGKAYMRLSETDASKRNYRKYLELRPNASDKVFVQGILGDK